MARKGLGFFNSKGQYFKTPEEATTSDLSALLGRIGDGDSLAPGIAVMLLDRREEIENIFAEHDEMIAERDQFDERAREAADNVTPLPSRDRSTKSAG